ncbi:sensor histidine kinase [Cryptosporangium aurantiacum]|uniref:histidine kinase n=1 Tax=Cryptosporangium aurantiacum TaxID=134849 RepID=A0A1M7RNM8_9ACTN|nr:HAMP domain-containing sensor histidine kinase [Cryptosporangium aurantiacum]SHN47760.1 two-component system, OmpR family, sensor kinase [Cryptosporangium aurantiacum]
MRLSRRWRELSLRARLLSLIVVLFAAGLLLTNEAVVAALRPPLVGRVDAQLRPIAATLSRLDPAAIEQFQRSADPPAQSLAQAPVALDLISQVWLVQLSADGEVVRTLRAGQEQGRTPDLPTLDTAAITRRAGEAFGLRAEDGTGWRAIAVSGPDRGGWVVAASLDEVETTVDRVRVTGLAIGAGVLALLALLAVIAVRAGLRPLRRIEETAAAIAGGDLTRRIPIDAGPRTEIGRLGEGLNGMLERIETAVAAQAASEARMRRFVADASHELRTPLAGIKGFAELHRLGRDTAAAPGPAATGTGPGGPAAGGPGGLDPTDLAMVRIEREATRLSHLVDDLLLLARLDSADPAAEPADLGLRPAPMDLRALAADALADLRALAPDRPAEITGPGGGPIAPAPAVGDEVRLRQVVSNLLGNAVAHTPAGTGVRIGVGTVDGRAVLEVADHGPGVPAELRDRVFERFYRADSSRTRDAGGGAGLGLAIAQSVALAHGGRVTLAPTPGGGATFRLELPSE